MYFKFALLTVRRAIGINHFVLNDYTAIQYTDDNTAIAANSGALRNNMPFS